MHTYFLSTVRLVQCFYRLLTNEIHFLTSCNHYYTLLNIKLYEVTFYDSVYKILVWSIFLFKMERQKSYVLRMLTTTCKYSIFYLCSSILYERQKTSFPCNAVLQLICLHHVVQFQSNVMNLLICSECSAPQMTKES